MKFGTAQNGQRRLFNFISKIFLMQQKTSARTLLLCPSSKIRQIQTGSLLKFLFVFYRIYFSTCSDAQSFGDSSFSSTSFSSIDRFPKRGCDTGTSFFIKSCYPLIGFPEKDISPFSVSFMAAPKVPAINSLAAEFCASSWFLVIFSCRN